MGRKIFGFILIGALFMSSSGCKLIYPNRVPVVKPKKRYGWYKPQYKRRKRTKVVWMKVHKGKFEKKEPKAPPPVYEVPTPTNQGDQ